MVIPFLQSQLGLLLEAIVGQEAKHRPLTLVDIEPHRGGTQKGCCLSKLHFVSMLAEAHRPQSPERKGEKNIQLLKIITGKNYRLSSAVGSMRSARKKK